MKRIVSASGKLDWGKRAYAVLALYAATAISLPAETFTVLHSFSGADGASPNSQLVQATNGDLYGTTTFGGANSCGVGGTNVGCGTVFKITPSGTLTTLYSFCSQSACADGEYPNGLVKATNGDLYGTTQEGGDPFGSFGTVFKITPSGALTTLYVFAGNFAGVYPAGLTQAANGEFYGTTSSGGAAGAGTVFKTTPAGALTTLYSFCSQTDCGDGENPFASLVQAANGDFYGTTGYGGAIATGTCIFSNGCGTVFRVTSSGALTTLHSFDGTDGAVPTVGGLVQAASGYLYGTTDTEGAFSGGTVFRITPSGTLATLYNFCAQSGCTDGGGPTGVLAQSASGSFYGTTTNGGANNIYGGTIFRITPTGRLTTLYSFCAQSGCTDGLEPAGLVEDTNGDFYGTTAYGGANETCVGYVSFQQGCGTVFRLSVGLGPFVETQTTSGEVGATVNILGSDLTGATSVSFNGIAAAFTVVSRSLITAAVPAGASTGTVEVVTPGGTLSSNVPFRVP